MEILVEGSVVCPTCGETFTTTVDTSQRGFITIEDCPVCCRPIELTVECEPGEILSIESRHA